MTRAPPPCGIRTGQSCLASTASRVPCMPRVSSGARGVRHGIFWLIREASKRFFKGSLAAQTDSNVVQRSPFRQRRQPAFILLCLTTRSGAETRMTVPLQLAAYI
eukprot:1491476-Pleurochrysis_carterae.AAC.1